MPRILEIQNRSGSVEHYYHFMLGFLAPLLLRLDDDAEPVPSIIRSCGPMDRHVAALALPNIEIVPACTLRRLTLEWPGDVERIAGFDDVPAYDNALFRRFRGLVLRHLGEPASPPRRGVLLVGRGRSPAFYQSKQAEIPGSANVRRSLPNLAAIGQALADSVRPLTIVELETTTLRDQVTLFAGAEAVVAQHGAALANILWMAPGAAVLEINPMAPGFRYANAFRALALACGHRYDAVPQIGPHAPVDPALIASRLAALLADR